MLRASKLPRNRILLAEGVLLGCKSWGGRWRVNNILASVPRCRFQLSCSFRYVAFWTELTQLSQVRRSVARLWHSIALSFRPLVASVHLESSCSIYKKPRVYLREAVSVKALPKKPWKQDKVNNKDDRKPP